MSKMPSGNMVQIDVNELEHMLQQITYKIKGSQHTEYVREINSSNASDSNADEKLHLAPRPDRFDRKLSINPATGAEVKTNAEHGPLIDHSIPQDIVLKYGAQDSDLAWSRIRFYLREPLAEFFGVFILILFGDGVVAQVVLSGGTKGDYQSINWGWG